MECKSSAYLLHLFIMMDRIDAIISMKTMHVTYILQTATTYMAERVYRGLEFNRKLFQSDRGVGSLMHYSGSQPFNFRFFTKICIYLSEISKLAITLSR